MLHNFLHIKNGANERATHTETDSDVWSCQKSAPVVSMM